MIYKVENHKELSDLCNLLVDKYRDLIKEYKVKKDGQGMFTYFKLVTKDFSLNWGETTRNRQHHGCDIRAVIDHELFNEGRSSYYSTKHRVERSEYLIQCINQVVKFIDNNCKGYNPENKECIECGLIRCKRLLYI